MSRSRIAAYFFLLFLVSSSSALAQTTAASKAPFKDACKAGYTYMIVPTASGVSVREAQRVDCTAKDATGALINATARECREQVGDIYWDCRRGLTEGTYKCEHKSCKNGEAISDPSAGSSGTFPDTSVQTRLPPVLVQETATGPLPLLSRQSIFDALREAPSNLGQESVYRSPTADSFEKFMLQAGLAPGALVPNTGNIEGGAFFSQTPSVNDAARLQGGTFSGMLASEVPTSQETGGTGGPNTFAPTQPAPFAEVRTATWEDRVSAFLGCTIGYFFGGCDPAEAHTPDSEVKKQNITVLSVKQNNGDAVAPEFFTQRPESEQGRLIPLSSTAPEPDRTGDAADVPKIGGAAPTQATLGAVPSSADLDTMTPAQLKEIEARLSADRSAQAAEDEAHRKAAIPKSPLTLRNNVIAGLFKAIGGGGTEDLKKAWEESILAQSNPEPVPVTPVLVADLAPIPGSEPRIASSPTQGLTAPEPEAPQPAAPVQPFTVDAKIDAQVREAFEAQKQSAQSQIRYFEDLLARSGTTVSEAAAQSGLDFSKERLNAITSEEKLYNDRAPSPALRSAIEQLQSGGDEGVWAKSFSSFAGSAHKMAAETAKEMQTVYTNPAELVGGLADGAIVLGSGFAGGVTEGLRNFATKAGVPGFEDDPNRALVDAVDPYKKYVQTAVDTTNVVPFTYGIYSVGKMGFGAVADMMSPAGIVARDLGVIGELSTPGARVVATDIVESGITAGGRVGASDAPLGAVTPSELSRVVSEAPIPRIPSAANIESGGIPAAPGPVSPFDKVTQAIKNMVESPAETPAPGPRLPSAANIESAGTPSAPGPYAAFDNAVADARTAAAQPTERSAVPSAAETPSAPSAAEDAAGWGLRADTAAAPRTLESEVDKLSMKDWAGGTGVTAGILCLGFCPSSEPLPQEAIPAEIVPLSKEDLALLFPQENKIQQRSAPSEVSMPVNVVVDETPVQASPLPATPPAAPAEQTALSPSVAPVVPPVLSAPPAVNESDLVELPTQINGIPRVGTPEFEQYADEQQKIVEANIEAQRKKNQEAFEAWEEAKRQKTKEIQDKIAQIEKEIVDMKLPSPVIVSQDAPKTDVPGYQGVGPLSSDDIAQGLLPTPLSVGSRRKDLEINFEFGSAKLTNDGREQVAALAQVMSRDEFRNSAFNIVGHTDTVGTAEANLILSRARAQAIVDILHRDYGIPLDQMKATGAGQWVLKVPILGNVPANRRVEIVVTPRK